MHKILQGAGASALAAATVITGLSFGPAALAVPPTPHADTATGSAQPANGTTFKLVVKNGDGRYWGQSTPSDTNLRTYATRALAEASSAPLSTTAVGNTFYARFTEGPLKDKCLSAGPVSGTPKLRFDASCGAPQTLFTVDSEGRLSSTSDGLYVATDTQIATGGRWYALGSGGWGASFAGLNSPLNVAITGKDNDERTVKLTGSGAPGSSIRINGTQTTPVDKDGAWSASVENLTDGANSLHLEDIVGTSVVSEKTYTVWQLAAVVSSPEAPTDDIVISGEAEPKATVSIEGGGSAVRATADAATGQFKASVPAPNSGGEHSFTVTQSGSGVSAASTTVAFDYGAAVSVSSPATDTTHQGGPIDFSGKGEPGGTVTVRENGAQGVLGSATVLPSANWSITGVNLEGTEHDLVVAQVSKGNNTTTKELTLSPGASSAPAAPTAMVTLEANVSSNALVSGTGTNGATISIKNYGTEIGTAKVVGGKWSTRIKALGAGSHTLSVTQTLGTETSPAATTTVDYGPALTVTSPVNSAVVDGKITFTGTGTKGSEIVVRAANRVPVCKVTMATTGPWSCTDTNNILPMGKYNVLVEQVAPGNLLTTAMGSVDHVPAGYVKPSVTTPADGSTVASHHPLITGKATPGATIRVKAEAGGTMIDTRAGSDGEWHGTPSFDLAPGKNNLTVTQIVNPGGHTDVVGYTLTATNAAPFAVAGPVGNAFVAGPITTVGSGPDGALVEVLGAGGVVVGRDTITDGTWSITDTDNLLPMGTFQYAVRMTVGTDQTTQLASVRHVPASFTEARVSSPANGSIVDTATPTFTGTATPGATIRLMKGDTVIAEGRALGDRSWTAATKVPLTEGLNPLTVVQIVNPGGVTVSHDNYLVAKR